MCSLSSAGSADPNGDAFTYLWNFGDGTATSTALGPEPHVPGNGPYTVTLTLTDAWGDAGSTTRQVSFIEPAGNLAPVPVIDTPIVRRTNLHLHRVQARPTPKGTRSPTCGTSETARRPARRRLPTHLFAVDGTYTVTLTLTDTWGKAASMTRNVTIAEPATNVAPIPVISTPSCVARVCTFSGVSSSDPNGDSFTYLWNFGDARRRARGRRPSKTYTADGTYTVTLTVTDAWGDFATTTRVVTIAEPAGNVPPAPVISDAVVRGGECTFSSVGTFDPNGDSFTYSGTSETRRRSTAANPSKTYAGAGTFTVTLTVTDGWGDAASTTRVVTITEPPTNVAPVPVIVNPPSCVALVCTFSSAGSADPNGDAFTRVWNWGDGTANTTSTTVTQAHTFPVAGTYTVTLTLTDWWGDAASTTRVVTVA